MLPGAENPDYMLKTSLQLPVRLAIPAIRFGIVLISPPIDDQYANNYNTLNSKLLLI